MSFGHDAQLCDVGDRLTLDASSTRLKRRFVFLERWTQTSGLVKRWIAHHGHLLAGISASTLSTTALGVRSIAFTRRSISSGAM